MNINRSFLANQNYKQKYIPPLLIFFLSLLAWFSRFIQDDAFISFRYAKNFAEGSGLVYNHTERVEGYTNFLWTIYISIPHYFQTDPILYSQVTGVLLFASSLFLVVQISRYFTGSTFFTLIAILLTGTNYTFLCYATGGLETQLVTSLLLTGILTCLSLKQSNSYKKLYLLSLVFTVLILTRPDNIIFISVMISYVIFINYQKERLVRKIAALLFPFTIIFFLYLLFKFNYYGDIIPNTVYAKVSANTSLKVGIYFIYSFLTSYWLAPLPFLLMFILFNRKNFNTDFLFLFSFIAAIIFFVLFVGGDFMEYRFFVPVIPLFFILTSKTLEILNSRFLTIAITLTIIAGSIFHAYNYKSEDEYKLHSIRELESQIYADNFNWSGIGKKLKKYFPNGITIATTAAGAIPYYSELTTVDMHGLNDKWIAKHGTIISHRPGHQRLATVDYLLKRKVNILIGHPFIMWESYSFKNITPLQFKNFFQFNIEELPSSAKIVKMPVENNYCLFFIYLIRSQKIDELIRRKRLDYISIRKYLQ